MKKYIILSMIISSIAVSKDIEGRVVQVQVLE